MSYTEWINSCLNQKTTGVFHFYSADLSLFLKININNNIYFVDGPDGYYSRNEPKKFVPTPLVSMSTNTRQSILLDKVTILHEIGHHECGHIKEVDSPKGDKLFQMELEAWNWSIQNWHKISDKKFPFDHMKMCLNEYYQEIYG